MSAFEPKSGRSAFSLKTANRVNDESYARRVRMWTLMSVLICSHISFDFVRRWMRLTADLVAPVPLYPWESTSKWMLASSGRRVTNGRMLAAAWPRMVICQ